MTLMQASLPMPPGLLQMLRAPRRLRRLLCIPAFVLLAAPCSAQEGSLGAAWLRDSGTGAGPAPRGAGKAALIDFSPIAAGGNRVDLGQDALAPPALIAAVQSGDAGALRPLVEGGIALNLPDAAGDTALMHAVRQGHIEVVRLLLEYGANPNPRGGNGLTPLMHTVLADDRWMARLLLRQGADPDGRDAGGQRPLFAAIKFARNAIAAELLRAGADIDLDNADKQSALVYAIVEGNTDVVRRIVASPRDLNREDAEGRTPLYWALFFKRFEAADLLLSNGARLGVRAIEMPAGAAGSPPANELLKIQAAEQKADLAMP